MSRRERPRVEPTDDWKELLPLFDWPESSKPTKRSGRWSCLAIPCPQGPKRDRYPGADDVSQGKTL
jgi:hypothetical protein